MLRGASAVKLKIATANVCTLYPKQDGAGRQDGAPNDKEVGMNASARRIALAELFSQEGIQILGVQEARTRWSIVQSCGLPCGSGTDFSSSAV